ncbi:hypothetical protein [Oceanobacillus massiliensis]|uniref:hypothetical protein n=1 Tax=Oceanobacillus massiliensis TaxID=1465765 RepID=UPI003015DEDD
MEDEDKEKLINAVKKVWNQIKEIVSNVVNAVIEIATQWIDYINNYTPVGYKRYLKMDQLKQSERISVGKSNNWRKIHGLSVRRGIR